MRPDTMPIRRADSSLCGSSPSTTIAPINLATPNAPAMMRALLPPAP
jgi:hypothetical protein